MKPVNPLNIRKITLTQPPLEVFSKLQTKYQNLYLLESIEGPQKLAQYSFIGFDPKTIIRITSGKTKITNNRTHQETIQTDKRPTNFYPKNPRKRCPPKRPISIHRWCSRLHLLRCCTLLGKAAPENCS